MALRRFDLEAGGDTFAFRPETEEKIAFWRAKYPAEKQRSAVIPLLWLAQKDNNGWLSEPAMREVADRLQMPYIRVYEVATFYTMFRLQPVGKYHVQLCGTTPCQLRGADKLKEVCKKEIGDKMYVTDDGRLSWEEVECLGACVNAPMVQINDDYYEDLTPESLTQILGKLKNGVEPTPGPQVDRVNSAPQGGAKALTDPALFDGSRNAIRTLPNLPAPAPEPEPVADPAQDALKAIQKTIASGAGAAAGEKKETAGERPPMVTIDPAAHDDLKRVKGIGPKNEDALNELGIYTFKQIAEWTPENVDWVEDFLSFPGRIERENWIGQAKLLAAGGETEFSKRVDAGEVPSSKDDED
ncbi:MAG: NADH-quinone oxidoreductase subunit NuoE [Hyphomonas sp.]|nr:NADH-quinone oxidoreductase subunit NuoE [Hyphomonas sp.]MCB9961554.1 NADH-quinone oxidoreductase subunit NuoE [Hyphomonas sp.]MCB9971730.1 NADH-quinone oxidoreductase subunit NuoE [Hyphomonas sp.]